MSKQNRRKFDISFKRDAVAQTEEGARTVQEVALSLGIRAELLYRWRTQLRAQGPIAFPGNGSERILSMVYRQRWARSSAYARYGALL